MKTPECIELLKESRPDIAITVSWEPDHYFSWDGDGEDPRNDGYDPHNVTVTASVIRNGELIQSHAYLGGCYSKNGGEDDPEISGYLDQLVNEAVEGLPAASF